MRIPHASTTLCRGVNVPLYHNRTGSYEDMFSLSKVVILTGEKLTRTPGSEQHVCDFNNTRRARRADPNHDLRIVDIRERRARSHNGAPCLTDHLSTRWNCDRTRNQVCACIEEDNFATGEL